MGWSCTQAAMNVLDTFAKDAEIGNSWHHKGRKYFYEVGRENEDGAITGSIWRYCSDELHAERVGSFKVNADGTIARAPYGMADCMKKEGV